MSTWKWAVGAVFAVVGMTLLTQHGVEFWPAYGGFLVMYGTVIMVTETQKEMKDAD